MKKTILFLVFAAVLGGTNLQAQDTLWQKPAPLGNYFYNNWFDTTEVYALATVRPVFASIIANRYVVENETLEVYGIAAMMLNFDTFTFQPSSVYPTFGAYLAWRYPDDPTLDNCEESLMLYQYHGAATPVMQQLGDSLPVHIHRTPVSYRIMSNTSPTSTWDARPKPVYERYFATPQTVTDTFYVGFTCTNGGFSKEDSIWHDVRPEFGCAGFRPVHASLGYDIDVAVYRHDSLNTPYRWDFLHNTVRHSYFIFPILTPEPDTTVVNPGDTIVNPNDTVTPGDTTGVGVRRTDMVYRYTTVSPNPATERATVTSSFGLERIEVYDGQGRQTLSLPASGYKATLDTRSWPSGTYLLRITTTLGTTTKKLLVR